MGKKKQRIQHVDPQSLTTVIESIAFMGEGMVRHEDGDPVFIPYTIPGERVRAEIVRKGRRYWEANLIEVETPSPDRVEAPCRYYRSCTGCQWQHIAYPRQLELKREIVTAELRAIGKFERPPVAL